MSYCCMEISKIKLQSRSILVRKYQHNYRTEFVPNADPDLKKNNEELVKLPEINGIPCDYLQAFQERLKKLDYYKEHKLRSNAVIAYEIVTSFSKDLDINIELWKKDNVQWLKDTFDICPKKYGSNVLSVMYHGDEAGNVHCHAIVMPVDERGHLCARNFTNGRSQMCKLQDSYAKAMSHHGLERGVKGSSARHQDIKKFYSKLNEKLEIPKVHFNESAEEFRSRIMEQLQNERAALFHDLLEKETRLKQKYDKKLQNERTLLTNAVFAENMIVKMNTEQSKKMLLETEKEKRSLENQMIDLMRNIEQLKRENHELFHEKESDKKMADKLKSYEHIMEVIDYARQYYPKIAADMMRDFSILEQEIERTGFSLE